MRTTPAIILIVLASITGCAARQTPRQTAYACPSGTIVPADGSGQALMVGQGLATHASSDSSGDHYMLVQGERVRDYVLPHDEREDALVWDTADSGRVLVERCTASGGHTDVLGRWLEGASLAEIGASIGVDNEREVKRRLRRAIIWMNRMSRNNTTLPARGVPGLAHQ